MTTGTELSYTTAATALQMAQTIVGDGVTVVCASYSGATQSKALYARTGHPPASGSGVILFTEMASDAVQTAEASALTLIFIATGNLMTISFTFAAADCPVDPNSLYNGAVSLSLNGALVQAAPAPTAQNLSHSVHPDSSAEGVSAAEGFAVTFSVSFPVCFGTVNTLRIGFGDWGGVPDDASLLLAAGSVQTALLGLDDPAPLPSEGNGLEAPGCGVYGITHINGMAVTAGQTVALASGELITLGADGRMEVTRGLGPEAISLTHTARSDVSRTTVEDLACFVAGTRIATPSGFLPVETLCPGDLVDTQDAGPQPLRWVSRTRVPAEGAFAPIRFERGAYGASRPLLLAPQHRVLVRDPVAELLFGTSEVLVAAKDLVDGKRVTTCHGGEVDYVHILFDRHHVVCSEDLAAASMTPMMRLAAASHADTMPLDDPAQILGPAPRQLLRSDEAQMLKELVA